MNVMTYFFAVLTEWPIETLLSPSPVLCLSPYMCVCECVCVGGAYKQESLVYLKGLWAHEEART